MSVGFWRYPHSGKAEPSISWPQVAQLSADAADAWQGADGVTATARQREDLQNFAGSGSEMFSQHMGMAENMWRNNFSEDSKGQSCRRHVLLPRMILCMECRTFWVALNFPGTTFPRTAKDSHAEGMLCCPEWSFAWSAGSFCFWRMSTNVADRLISARKGTLAA